ncbi:class II glutamine amidotransferase [Mycolicibacterium agri]|uniref:Class II glutamine amidotransferase n=1 Tax=Mycolicibacterium agri TaxID=36811 RepID=A0A2A7NBS2_MYCAG|nr:class II glutamine amidotransferase [Mycolicibacterium agri]PEG41495.1 class II glutamine amidotransferase [Mycolicibacterium agri]GFG53099.1 class II glutamine amidotransferase [Mycolicibacterium agri]
MCRLLGVVSATPVSVAQAVGEHVLKDFVALTKIHGDGWGLARVDRPGDDPQVEVSAGSALDDPQFDAAMRAHTSTASLVHLRWATTGLAVAPENSHPFLADRIAMAHNGSVKPIETLDALLTPDVATTLRGSTDSERYFAMIRQHRASSRDLAEAVRRAVSRLREVFPDASLNAVILGEDQLIAVHAHARSRLPDEDIAEITAADLPAEHLEDYFGMRWARVDDKIVVASTGFGDLDWQPLAEESVTAISVHDMSMTTLPLMTNRP